MSLLYKRKILNNYTGRMRKIYKLFYFDFMTKLNIYNNFMFLQFDKVICSLVMSSGLKSETDTKIINALCVLDFFFQKKTEIHNLAYVYVQKSRLLIFICRNVVQQWLDILFILFLIRKIIEPTLSRKFILFKFKVFTNGFYIYINDVSHINLLPDFLKVNKYGVKLSFYFKHHYPISFMNLFLKYFGIC